MKSDEFAILNEKLDAILVLLQPRERAWIESKINYDSINGDEYCRVSNAFSKRSHKMNNPWDSLPPEKQAAISAAEELVWKSLSDDGTVTSDQRKFYEVYSKELDKE